MSPTKLFLAAATDAMGGLNFDHVMSSLVLLVRSS